MPFRGALWLPCGGGGAILGPEQEVWVRGWGAWVRDFGGMLSGPAAQLLPVHGQMLAEPLIGGEFCLGC